jgi:hypothetical protein
MSRVPFNKATDTAIELLEETVKPPNRIAAVHLDFTPANCVEQGIATDTGWADGKALTADAETDNKLIVGIAAREIHVYLTGTTPDRKIELRYCELGASPDGVDIPLFSIATMGSQQVLSFDVSDNDYTAPGVIYLDWEAGLNADTVLDIIAYGRL